MNWKKNWKKNWNSYWGCWCMGFQQHCPNHGRCHYPGLCLCLGHGHLASHDCGHAHVPGQQQEDKHHE